MGLKYYYEKNRSEDYYGLESNPYDCDAFDDNINEQLKDKDLKMAEKIALENTIDAILVRLETCTLAQESKQKVKARKISKSNGKE